MQHRLHRFVGRCGYPGEDRFAVSAAPVHAVEHQAVQVDVEVGGQPRLPAPTRNISSIRAQERPTQNKPWWAPSTKASRAGARPRQCDITQLIGVRHCSRQRYLSRLNWNAPASITTAAPISSPRRARAGTASTSTASARRSIRTCTSTAWSSTACSTRPRRAGSSSLPPPGSMPTPLPRWRRRRGGAALVHRPVELHGRCALAFQSCSAATFTYSFTGGSSAGAGGVIALSRVGPIPPGCAM